MIIIEQILELLIVGLENLFSGLFGLLERIAMPANGVLHYSAHFISGKKLLSKRNKGFCLNGTHSLTAKDSYQNALIIGGTGVGKTSTVLLPTLFRIEGSLIINDPSKELFNKSARHLAQRGYNIKVLDFSNPQKSNGYNPLLRATSNSEINKLAAMIVRNSLSTGTSEPFWELQAVSLLTTMITLIKDRSKEHQSLSIVRDQIKSLAVNPKIITKIVAKSENTATVSEYRAFLALDEKVRQGVIATCLSALQIFSDESVRRVTSSDTINMTEFRLRKTALFIQSSIADQQYYSVISSIFFEQYFAFLFGQLPSKAELDVFLLMDEASSLKLPSLPNAVVNIRKYRGGIMQVIQTYEQLVANYGRHQAAAIKSNSFAELYFTGQPLDTCIELEQLLGRFQGKDQSGRERIRELLTRDEIRTMAIDTALLICGNYKPILTRLIPYYKK